MNLRSASKGIEPRRGCALALARRVDAGVAAASSSATSVGSPCAAGVASRDGVVAEHGGQMELAEVAGRESRCSPRVSRFWVSVPVLSEATTVVLPSVSTAGRCRMIAWRRAIRWTPMASAIVTTAGSPSGTAATARLMPARAASENGKPRTAAASASRTAATPIASVIARPTRSSSRVSGVSSTSTCSSSEEMRPSSVEEPVATATPCPVPAARACRRAQTLSLRQRSGGRNRRRPLVDGRRLAGERGFLGSQPLRLEQPNIGGTRSPRRPPPRRPARSPRRAARPSPRRAGPAGSATSSDSAAIARPARNSWAKPIKAFRTTTASTTTPSSTSATGNLWDRGGRAASEPIVRAEPSQLRVARPLSTSVSGLACHGPAASARSGRRGPRLALVRKPP